MATKQEKAVKRAVDREKNKGKVREEKHWLWLLLALILVLLYLLLAQHKGWWPYTRPKLGSAFYTNVSADVAKPKSSPDSSGTSGSGSNGGSNSNGGTGSSGNSGSNGTNGSNGSNSGGNTGGNNSGGSTTTPPPTSSTNPLANFVATIDVGSTKAQVDGQANGLNEKCAVIASATAQTVGKQEVCTYSQGDKIVTVTYLNDRVISASKSGF